MIAVLPFVLVWYCQVFLDAKHNDDMQMECRLQLDLSCPDFLFETITSKVTIYSCHCLLLCAISG